MSARGKRKASQGRVRDDRDSDEFYSASQGTDSEDDPLDGEDDDQRPGSKRLAKRGKGGRRAERVIGVAQCARRGPRPRRYVRAG